MALFNYASKEITLKVVYYGPGLSGKTTNIQYLHEILSPDRKGKLLSLSTEADRTLFFDFLPVALGKIKDFSIRFQLYTVPGQVRYNATRKLVLKGADAIVFVADSQREMREQNIESFQNMRENLIGNNIDPNDIPLVLQYNKRDLPNVLSEDELNKDLNDRDYKTMNAAAIDGTGVEETFQIITKLLLLDIAKKHRVEIKPEDKPGAEPAKAAPPPPPPPPVKEPKEEGISFDVEPEGEPAYAESVELPEEEPATQEVNLGDFFKEAVEEEPSEPEAEEPAAVTLDIEEDETPPLAPPVPESASSFDEDAFRAFQADLAKGPLGERRDVGVVPKKRAPKPVEENTADIERELMESSMPEGGAHATGVSSNEVIDRLEPLLNDVIQRTYTLNQEIENLSKNVKDALSEIWKEIKKSKTQQDEMVKSLKEIIKNVASSGSKKASGKH